MYPQLEIRSFFIILRIIPKSSCTFVFRQPLVFSRRISSCVMLNLIPMTHYLKHLILIAGLAIAVQHTFAQDTLWLLNGKKMIVENLKLDKENEVVLFSGKKDKLQGLYYYDVFSVTDSLGKETILYAPQNLRDGLEVEQMRSFIQGEAAATWRYKPAFAPVAGFLVGFASPFVQPQFAPVFPLAYSIAVGRRMPNTPAFVRDHLAQNHDMYYLLGYTDVIRKKNTVASLAGGGAGLVLGYMALLIIENNR